MASIGDFLPTSGGSGGDGGGSGIALPPGVPEVLLGFASADQTTNAYGLFRIGSDNLGQLWNTAGQRFLWNPDIGFKLFQTGSTITTPVGIPTTGNGASTMIASDDDLFYFLGENTGGAIYIYDHNSLATGPDQTLTAGSYGIGWRNSQSGDILATTSNVSTDHISIYKNVGGTWGPAPVSTFPPIFTAGIANVKIGNSGQDLFVSYFNTPNAFANEGYVEYRQRSGDDFSTPTQTLIPPTQGSNTEHDLIDFDGTTLVTYVNNIDIGDPTIDTPGTFLIWRKPVSTWEVEDEIPVSGKNTDTVVIGDDIYIRDRNYKIGGGKGAILNYTRDSGTWSLRRALVPTEYGLPTQTVSFAMNQDGFLYIPNSGVLSTYVTFGSSNLKLCSWKVD